MTELHKLHEPLEIPEAEIATVLDWLKAEQVRIIQRDRTLSPRQYEKLDWLTDLADHLKLQQERATDDQIVVNNQNNWRRIRNERIVAEAQAKAAAAKTCFCDTCCACKKEG